MCLMELFSKCLKNWNLAILRNMLSVIIAGGLYGPELGFSWMDLVFLWHIDRAYIGGVPFGVIFEIYEKKRNLAVFRNMLIFGLSVIMGGSLYGPELSLDSRVLVHIYWSCSDGDNFWNISKIVILAYFLKMTISGLKAHRERLRVYSEVVMTTLWGRICKENVKWKTLWGRRCEKNVVRNTLWKKKRCEKDIPSMDSVNCCWSCGGL